ncbi:UNVERIFIED_CONTAM: hypothetical protein RMT77_017020 [Armadillidium vulgare]
MFWLRIFVSYFLLTITYLTYEISVALSVNIYKKYPIKFHQYIEINNSDNHQIYKKQSPLIGGNVWLFEDLFEQSLKRKKRFFWNKDNDQNTTTSTPVTNLNSIKNFADQESTTTVKSWRSWFSGAAKKVKSTYNKAIEKLKSGTSNIKKGIKKVGRKIVRGILNIRKYFTRSEDKFTIFANKVKERVEEGDENAINLLHKLGIDVNYDKDGHLIGSEVNKTSLPVKDILIKEGIYYESNATLPEEREVENGLTSLEQTTKTITMKPTSKVASTYRDFITEGKYTTKQTSLKGVSSGLNESTFASPETFNTTAYISITPKTITKEKNDTYSRSEPVNLKTIYSYITEPSILLTTDGEAFPTTVKSKTNNISETTFKIEDLTKSFGTTIMTQVQPETSTVSFSTNTTSQTRSGMSSETRKVQDESTSTYASTTKATTNPIRSTSASSIVFSTDLTDEVKGKSSIQTVTTPFAKTTKNESSGLSTPSTEFSSDLSHPTAETKDKSLIEKATDTFSSDFSHFTTEVVDKSSAETITKPYTKATQNESLTLSKTSEKFSPDASYFTAVGEHKSSTETVTKPYTKTATKESSVLYKSSEVFSRHPSYYTEEEVDKFSKETATTPFVKTTTKATITTQETRFPSHVSSVNFESSTDSENTEVTEKTQTRITESSSILSTTMGSTETVTTSTMSTTEGSTTSTEPPPFPDIFKESGVRERLHEVFMKGDFSHDDLRTTFEFDPALYEDFYAYDYK